MKDFAKTHPEGSLGKRLLKNVQDIMIKKNIPILNIDASFSKLINITTKYNLGIALITNKEKKIHAKEYHHFYKLLTWNKYLIASIEQKRLLKKYLDKTNYDLREVGVIPFEGKKFNSVSYTHLTLPTKA